MKLYIRVNGGFEEFMLNIMLYVCYLMLFLMLAIGTMSIIHHFRYTCVQGHHAWVTHHSKGGHHTYWEFVCDKEVLNSDVNKCNCK